MKNLVVLAMVLLLFSFCGKKQEEYQTGSVSQTEGVNSSDSSVVVIKPKPINYDSMFVVLKDLADKIRQAPHELGLRQQLVAAGYDTTWETIMAVGMSQPVVEDSSGTLADRKAEQAAKLDAYRWCAYIKRWKENPNFSDAGQINADLSGGRIVKMVKLPDNRIAVMIEVKSHLIQ